MENILYDVLKDVLKEIILIYEDHWSNYEDYIFDKEMAFDDQRAKGNYVLPRIMFERR